MPEHRSDLFATHPGKPFKEILNARSALQIFKKSPHWNTGSLENPRTADFVGLSLNRWALAPILHPKKSAILRKEQPAIERVLAGTSGPNLPASKAWGIGLP